MFSSTCAAIAVLHILGAATSTEQLPAYGVGKRISTAFLLELTDPQRTGYRIGIVNTEVATGILLRQSDSPTAVEYVRGAESFLWAQAAEQLPSIRLEDPLHFRVHRRIFDATTCSELPPLIAAFQDQLEVVLARPVSITSPAPAKYRSIDAEGHEEITLDGAKFWIQISLADAILIVSPDGGSEPPLQQATRMLHSKLSQCANSVKPKTEEHDF